MRGRCCCQQMLQQNVCFPLVVLVAAPTIPHCWYCTEIVTCLFYFEQQTAWLMTSWHRYVNQILCIKHRFYLVDWFMSLAICLSSPIIPSQNEEWIPIRQGGRIFQGLWERCSLPPGVILHSVDYRWWARSTYIPATGDHHLFLPCCWVNHPATAMHVLILVHVSLFLPSVILFDVPEGPFFVSTPELTPSREEVPISQCDKTMGLHVVW